MQKCIDMSIKGILHNPAAGGVLLLSCALAAVFMASVPSLQWFDRIWDIPASVNLGNFSLEMSLREWINDALMAVFFFLAGLEIKREMVAGRLSSVKKSTLPVMAALGGMLFPALIYAAFNSGNPETAGGWGIPMATDIAFAVGVLSVLGDRVPAGVKIFLMTLAVVDDLGAIVVLALFYPVHPVDWMYFGFMTFILAVLVVMNIRNVRRRSVYLLLGLVLWYFTYMSGIHATVAGVLLAMTIPSGMSVQDADGNMRKLIDPRVLGMESRLSPLVNLLIVPLFALANAGVAFMPEALAGGMSPVVPGIFFGLLLGKPAGIFLFSFLSIKSGLAVLPAGVKWSHVAAVGMLGGIGFTMSIFIDNLSFADQMITDTGKLAILVTSVIAMVLGLVSMAFACKKQINHKIIKDNENS